MKAPTIAGPLEIELTVSTTGTDADWVVKLIDVYPQDATDPEPNPANVRMGGYQQLVRGDVMRGKFRNSFEKPEPFESGKPTKVKFVIPDTCHTFRPGHRIMIQVQSSWFPLVDRNPQIAGIQYECAVPDVTNPNSPNRSETVIPECTAGGPIPCWRFMPDPMNCASAPENRSIVIDRGGASVDDNTVLEVQCVTCDPDPEHPELCPGGGN